MKKTDVKLLKKIAYTIKHSLPQSFFDRYWDMANTTYQEEIAWSYIEDLKLDLRTTKWFLRKCGIYKKTYPVLYFKLDGHIAYSMGAHYGITDIGRKFIENFIYERGKYTIERRFNIK